MEAGRRFYLIKSQESGLIVSSPSLSQGGHEVHKKGKRWNIACKSSDNFPVICRYDDGINRKEGSNTTIITVTTIKNTNGKRVHESRIPSRHEVMADDNSNKLDLIPMMTCF